MQQSRIATHFNTDPADDKRFDWEAWFAEVPSSPKGYGESKDEAIKNLTECGLWRMAPLG